MADDNKSLSFSERMGITPVRTALQVDSIDEALRNGLWNILTAILWNPLQADHKISEYMKVGGIVIRVWTNHLKRAVDTLKPITCDVGADLRESVFSCSWNRVYEFVEFVASDPDLRNWCVNFTERCNQLLEREGSA